jgi:hypothetical protein
LARERIHSGQPFEQCGLLWTKVSGELALKVIGGAALDGAGAMLVLWNEPAYERFQYSLFGRCENRRDGLGGRLDSGNRNQRCRSYDGPAGKLIVFGYDIGS